MVKAGGEWHSYLRESRPASRRPISLPRILEIQMVRKVQNASLASVQDKAHFDANGYVLIRGLFTPAEVAFYRDHFMALRAQGPKPHDMPAPDPTSSDPLARYPRMIHMHRWDDPSRQWLLDPRLDAVLTTLLGASPLAVQTMLYFKPPGARGQALHQDNWYLHARPGTCCAAWMSLDRADEQNGCMRLVPQSHTWPILCAQPADITKSFTDVTVALPPGVQAVPIVMEPGDVLFFHGSLVHGSLPNTTSDRFRRSLIAHYIEAHVQAVTQFDQPVLRMDGTAFELEASEGGGPCGQWVDQDGQSVIEMVEPTVAAAAHE
jgi:ectoine hydroxylase-related dioxygenase (phytanoyl-CoA dioxygenase family)